MRENIIELNNITFTYFGNDMPSLRNVSLNVKKGEWLSIIGPNGSGKSTLAKIINGLFVADSGQVVIDKQVLTDESVWEIRRQIGMVFQNPDNQFVGATVEDDVAFGLENNGVPRDEMIVRVKEALEKVNMYHFIQKEPARLSGGQKQRVALASVLALRPQVIILDEATSMLDPRGRAEVISAVRALKEQFDLTVISITHDLDEAALSDRILIMNQGKIHQVGSPEEIFSLGDRLIEMGLDVPFAQKLKKELVNLGVDINTKYENEEALFNWITTSYLKM